MSIFKYSVNNPSSPIAEIQIKDDVLTLYYHDEFSKDPNYLQSRKYGNAFDRNRKLLTVIRDGDKQYNGLHDDKSLKNLFHQHYPLQTSIKSKFAT